MTTEKNSYEGFDVLVVDDEEAARYGIRRALSSLGCRVEEAGSVDEAQGAIVRSAPDLLLLDVNLPGRSGLDLLRELNEQGGESPLVVLISAHGSERMAVEAMKAGGSSSRTRSKTSGLKERTVVCASRSKWRPVRAGRCWETPTRCGACARSSRRSRRLTRPCSCAASRARARSWSRARFTSGGARAAAARSSPSTARRCPRS